MGNQSQTETNDGSGRNQQQGAPKENPLKGPQNQFTRDPAEGSRETAENNLEDQED